MGNQHPRIYIQDKSRILQSDKPHSKSPIINNDDLVNERNSMLEKALDAYKERNFELSLKIYNYMKKQFPMDDIPWILEGDIVFQIGGIEESIGLYSKALQLNPQSSQTWIRIAKCFTKMKNYAESARYFENAIISSGTTKSVYTYIMSLLQLSRHDEALYMIDRYGELKSPDAQYHSYRAAILIESGKEFDAEIELDQVLKYKNVPLLAYTSLIILNLSRNEYQNVLFLLESALSISQSNGHLYGYRALAHIGMNNIEEAKKDIELSFKMSPKNQVGLLAKAKVLFIEKKPQKSLQIADVLADEKGYGNNRYIQSEITKLIAQLETKNEKNKLEQFNETKITHALKYISQRHGLMIDDDQQDPYVIMTSIEKKNQIKSNVKVLMEILKSKLSIMENDIIKLHSMNEEVEKIFVNNK